MASLTYRHRAWLPGAALVLLAICYLPLGLDYGLAGRFTLLALLLSFFLLVPTSRLQLPRHPVFLIYALFAAYSLLSPAWAINREEAFFSAFRTLLGLFSFCVCVSFFSRPQNTATLAPVCMVVCVAEFTVLLFQLPGISSWNREALYAISGLHSHKNLLASFLFLQLPFLAWGFLDLKGRFRVLSATVLAITLLTLILLKSRAIYMGLGLAFVVVSFFAIIKKRVIVQKRWKIVLTCLFIFLFNAAWLAVFPLTTTDSVQAAAGQLADEERLQLWKKSLTMFLEHPLWGVGAGNWQIHFPDQGLDGIWRAEDLNVTFQRPHNDLLWELSEKGAVGYNLWALVISFVLAAGVVNVAGSEGKARMKGILMLSGLCGYIVISYFDFPRERIEHTVWFNMLLAAIIAGTDSTQHRLHFTPRKLLRYLAAGICAFVAFAGFFRLSGEIHTRKIYELQSQSNHAAIVQSAAKAHNYFYSMDPLSMPIPWYGGTAWAAVGNYPRAMEEFEKAYALHPYNRNVLNDLASAWVMAGRISDAKELYRKAAEISPRFDEPILNLVAVLIREKSWTEAKTWLDKLKHDSPRRTQYTMIVNSQLIP